MRAKTEKFFKILYLAFYIAITVIVVLLLISFFPIKNNYQIKIVKSGSMEPSINTGSLVIIKPSKNYNVGDIITFGKDTKNDIPTTHRIVSSHAVSGVIMFTTKGDANSSKDINEIKQADIHGKVLFSIPFLGYLIDFARKPLGLIILVILPATIIIFDEVKKIISEITMMRKRKQALIISYNDKEI